MKKKLLAGMLGLFLAIRLLPAFSISWAERISLPLLEQLAGMSSLFSFALLEWVWGAACIAMLISFFRRRLLKFLSDVILAVLLCCLVVWYPLYFQPQPDIATGNTAIARLCERLIDETNICENEFSLPADMPAKFIRFPQWMDTMGITGICSFLTGEALVTPLLDDISLPFVAVHENMHLQGHAGEGAANIAAWEECIALGGTYAASARIWALRYGMGILHENDHVLYESSLLRMNHKTLQAYREAGGAYTPVQLPEFLRRLLAFLGIETAVQDYETLAPYLAAEYME